jgi:hypothetical protein
MRHIQLVLFTAIAVLGLAASAQAATFTITVGNYDLLPNTPGQKIPLYVTGIVPRADAISPSNPGNVTGIELSVAIGDGGVAYGGEPGPLISSIDVDSGPTIWVAPQSPFGHNSPSTYYEGQLANVNFLTTEGYVNVTGGLFATLIIDTTGFNDGTYSLRLDGSPSIVDNMSPTTLLGVARAGVPRDVTNIIYEYYGGKAGQITIVPEPSTVVLAAIGLIGLAAWGWRRKRF